MSTHQKMMQIRSRKLGLLIYDARMAANKTTEQCAAAIGITPSQFQTYEHGDNSPTLPEMEALAYFLDVPLEHFWGREAMGARKSADPVPNVSQLNKLRSRVISTQLRMARSKLNLTLPELSQKTDIPEAQLKAFEMGEKQIQLAELETLAASLGMQIEEFFDSRGPVGSWRAQQKKVQQFLELSPELQEFVVTPVNRPYIELAIRLSELNADKLRAVAEGLLEITY